MSYIVLTELETTGSVTTKLKALPASELSKLQSDLTNKNVMSTSVQADEGDFFEADTSGVHMLNLLEKYYYKVISQSMVIEKTNIGGRTVQIQKIVWTMHKQ